MATGVKFTPESAKRIASAVRKVEGSPTPPLRYRRGNGGGEGGRVLVCKTAEAATQGGTYTCTIWDGATQAAFATTGDDIEVYFRLGDCDSGKWILVVETTRGYEALATEC